MPDWVLSELGHSAKELRTVACVKDLDGDAPAPPVPHLRPRLEAPFAGLLPFGRRGGKLGLPKVTGAIPRGKAAKRN
jgi:hypothetical protein